MADYTEEQRVKQSYPDAVAETPLGSTTFIYAGTSHKLLGVGGTKAEAWSDASRRLGNEFVDEVGPLAERKEG